jgi:hypothetical protein
MVGSCRRIGMKKRVEDEAEERGVREEEEK